MQNADRHCIIRSHAGHRSRYDASCTIPQVHGWSILYVLLGRGNLRASIAEEGSDAIDKLADASMMNMTRRHFILRHFPVFLALLAIGAIYALLSAQFAFGLRYVLPVLLLVLLVLLA